MDGLIEGRIVHYVNSNGQHMAAIVVNVLDKENGDVNLQVFEDMNGIKYDSRVGYSAEHSPYTWHWVEQEVAPVAEPLQPQAPVQEVAPEPVV